MRTISAEQVAILAERVDTLINNYSKVEGILTGISMTQSATSAQLGVLQERIAQADINHRRAISITDEQGERLEGVAQAVNVHAWTWKLFGACVMVSLGLVAWAFKEVQTLAAVVNRQDNKLTILEYIVNGRQMPIERVEK